jgi:lipoate-protein ligase B
MKSSLQVFPAGIISYDAALALQEAHRDRIFQGKAGPALFLLQHPPTITIGSVTQPGDLLLPDDQLSARGISVARIRRGGRATYHGPGQLVGYPVLDLQTIPGVDPRGPSLRQYLRDLEEVLIRLLKRLGVQASRVEGETGVWVQNRKIASIGVSVRRWVTCHGFALNVDLNLADFQVIRPCGFDAMVMTSVAHEGGHLPPWPSLLALAARCFAEVFDFSVWSEDAMPQLQAAAGVGPR